MSSPLPIVVRRLINLADSPYNLPDSAFRYGYLSIESDKYICVKYVSGNETNVTVVDLHNDNAMMKKPTKKAEAALMHTSKNVIVLKGRNPETSQGHFIQIFDLDSKDRLLDHIFQEDVVYWKWVSDSVLAIITVKSVWHCSLDQSTTPYKVFDRAGLLAGGDVQIIHYTVDASQKWCLLAGIYSHDKRHVEGALQLYSIDRKQHQLLEGHSGCFSTLMVSPIGSTPINVFCFSEKKNGRFIVHIMHLDLSRTMANSIESFNVESSMSEASFHVTGEIVFPDDLMLDFPIFMHLSSSDGLLFIVTRGGCLFLIDPFTATTLLMHRISSDAVFASCASYHKQLYTTEETGNGILLVNRKGGVYCVGIREAALVPYIQQSLVHLPMCRELALSFVQRYGYSGATDILLQFFNAAFSRGDWAMAARIAATAVAKNVLRTTETLKRFQSAPCSTTSGMTPILQYFTILLDHGALNKSESLELIRTVVSQNHVELVERWLDNGKLTCTEELGDAVKAKDPALALRIYDQAKATCKVLQICIEQGKYEKILAFINELNKSPKSNVSQSKISSAELISCLRSLAASDNPASIEASVRLAQETLNKGAPLLLDIEQIMNIFIENRRYREITKVLLEYLKEDRPEQGHLQTKLFEISFAYNPGVVEAIFQTECFTHYDRKRIGMLAEKAGHIQRALQLATDPQDIKRLVITYFNDPSTSSTPGSTQEWFLSYFERSLIKIPDTALECLQAILRGSSHNLQVVVQIAIKHHEQLGDKRLISLFESSGCWEGLYKFLGGLIAFNTDPDVNFKYIEAAVMLNNIREVERFCRESTCYDPGRVKDFLKQAKLSDPRPLIYVCDLHGFIAELTEYLYHNGFTKFIEVYALRVSPQKTPLIVGVLLDLDCSGDFIKVILQGVKALCPVAELVAEVEKRNRLRIIETWLEARASEGNQDPHLHNALAKIRIDSNENPEEFLKNNMFYEGKIIGDYCAERDPYLALIAYKKQLGTCDEEIIELTKKNGLFRLQARYLVERQNSELWARVLDSSNPHRDAIVDQVVSSALPESTSPGEICATVRAFVDANIPNALMELLEKIVLHNSAFSQNRNLQNLLIITAIKSAPSRVVDYINKFENYNGLEVAQVLTTPECGMYEEAFAIYDKCGKCEEAVSILLKNIKDMERAVEYAMRCSSPGVWSHIAKEQLAQSLVSESIDSFIKARDPSCYQLVIRAAANGNYSNLLSYLKIVKEKLTSKDSLVDSELLYLLVKEKRLSETKELLSGPNAANVGTVADRFFEEELYEEALILYNSLPNYPKVVSCHLKIKAFQAAIDAAKKANNSKTWTEVNIACVNAGEFRSAYIAGLAILSHPDHLEDLIQNYERAGYFEQLVKLLEAGVSGGQRPSAALLTELCIVYAKYRPEKLSTFLRSSLIISSAAKLNFLKLVRVCEKEFLWPECIQLYTSYGEFDQAASVMISHPGSWSHTEFLSILQQCNNTELYYKALSFYLDIAPLQLSTLLTALSSKLDHSRVVQQFRKTGNLKLLETYLEYVQKDMQLDLSVVNTALCEIYLKERNVRQLEYLINNFENFDQVALAKELESNSLASFRKLAALLYRKNELFEQCITLSKRDKFDSDAIEAAKFSNHVETVENLLRYFISERQDINCFLACLTCCYHLVRPDVVLELAWRHKCTDHIMPFVIQTIREYSMRLDAFEKKCLTLHQDFEPPITSQMDTNYNSYGYASNALALTSFPSTNLADALDSKDISEYGLQSATNRLNL